MEKDYYELKEIIYACYRLNRKKCEECRHNTTCKEYLEFKKMTEERKKEVRR